MKLTKSKLKQLIKEELKKVLKEADTVYNRDDTQGRAAPDDDQNWNFKDDDTQGKAALKKEGAYEDDPSFQHEVDQEYAGGSPQTLGDLATLVGVDDIEKYFQDMGYMIVPVEDMQMSPDQAGDYEASAAKTDPWDMTKGGTGARASGMGRMQKESK